jgi:hypothetical protein
MIFFKRTNIEVLDIFEFKIFKCKVPSHLYNKKTLKKDVDKLFDSEIVKKYGSQSLQRTGKAYSTCGLGIEHIINLSEVKPLLNHISDCILKNFYQEKNPKVKILYTRMWSNMMYKGCEGTCHTHEGDNDGTAVFYLNVPKNGSDFIVFKYNIGQSPNDNFKHISHSIKVKTGDLFFYDKRVPHSVSKHMNDEPRICFVLDFKKINI